MLKEQIIKKFSENVPKFRKFITEMSFKDHLRLSITTQFDGA